jgi:hypothetical protein
VVVVDNVGEVVGRVPVAFEDGEVALSMFVGKWPEDDVLDTCGLVRAFELDGELLAAVRAVVRLLPGDGPACARVR